ncbi:MAG: enoyl-CoA hydratase [Alphaproteobacteria bacterium]|nr:enoyl-CoA hydratase [Alphaproteobacteria bacterium]
MSLSQLIDRPEGIEIHLDRPKAYNALSLDLMEEIIAHQATIAAQAQAGKIQYVIVSGSGKGFCAGHDLREIQANKSQAFYEKTFAACTNVMLGFQRLPVPVIAKVHGIATAAGCQMVASVDLAVATPDARFATPGVHIGLFCSTPMVALTRAVSRKRAMEMLVLGDTIDAHTAKEYGLINAVDADPETVIAEWTTKILAKSRRVLSIGKQAFYQQIEQDVESAYQHTAAVMTQNLLHAEEGQDAQEGIQAFLQKRQPIWTQ